MKNCKDEMYGFDRTDYEREGRYSMNKACPYVAHEEVDVTVPVTVRAKSNCSKAEIRCMGCPVVKQNTNHCPGKVGAVSRFTVKQRMSLDVPITFDMEADVGEGHIEYGCMPGMQEPEQPFMDIDDGLGGHERCEKHHGKCRNCII